MKAILLALTCWSAAPRLLVGVFAAPAWAVQPDEMLDDPGARGAGARAVKGPALPGLPEREHRRIAMPLLPATCGCWCASGWWRATRTRRWWSSSSTATANSCCCSPTTGGANLLLWAAGPLMLLAALARCALHPCAVQPLARPGRKPEPRRNSRGFGRSSTSDAAFALCRSAQGVSDAGRIRGDRRMQYETIPFDIRDDIATVTLNRPDVMNALNTQMRAEITDAVAQGGREARVAGADRGRACLLFGAGSRATVRMPPIWISSGRCATNTCRCCARSSIAPCRRSRQSTAPRRGRGRTLRWRRMW